MSPRQGFEGDPFEAIGQAAEAVGKALTSECAQGAVAVSGLLLVGVTAGSAAGAAVASGGLVTTSASSIALSATAVGYLGAGAVASDPSSAAELALTLGEYVAKVEHCY